MANASQSQQWCAVHMVVSNMPTLQFGVFRSPIDVAYYKDVCVTQVAVVSDTEQHVWDLDGASGAGDYSIVWNQMLVELMDVLDRYEVLVGHYMARDVHAFTAELYRRKLSLHAATFFNKPYECLLYVASATHPPMRKHPLGNYPTLLELYTAHYPSSGRRCGTEPTGALDRCKMIYDCYIKMHDLPREPVFHASVVEWGRRRTNSAWQFVRSALAPAVRRLRTIAEL